MHLQLDYYRQEDASLQNKPTCLCFPLKRVESARLQAAHPLAFLLSLHLSLSPCLSLSSFVARAQVESSTVTLCGTPAPTWMVGRWIRQNGGSTILSDLHSCAKVINVIVYEISVPYNPFSHS